ncbi:MAG: PAS domain S-box protein [Thermodesulfobacteriota bacterium]|nr:PAS domain S-box protein [Thermodesulfobacteriota bacterium]
MKDQDKTREQLIDELIELRQKLNRLETLQNEYQQLGGELRKIRTVFDMMIDGVTITDMEGRITDINRAATEQIGYTFEEAIGKTPSDLFIAQRDRTKFLLKEHPKAVSEGSISASEYILKHKNGREFLVSVNISSLRDSDGTPIGVVAVQRDITEQKYAHKKLMNAKDDLERRVKERTSELMAANRQLQEEINERKRAEVALHESEEKYRNIFEDSRDAIYISARDGKCIDVNSACLDLFGYKREEIVGIDVMKLYANSADRKEFQKDIETKGSVKDYNIKVRKKDGSKKDCLFTSTVRRNSDGTILGYQGTIRDVTEKKRREKESQKVQKLESVGILAGGIAHDFNNILMGISGNITLAKLYTNAGNSVFERLLEMEKGVLQARDLTQQFLTFSKGGAPIKKTTSIKEIIEVSVNFTLRGSNCQCEFFLPDDLWPVEVDKGQISQVMNNLIMNSMEALPEGGIIKVYAENTVVLKGDNLPLKEGHYIKVSIEDQGHGIPKKDLSNIFDPYFTTKQKGSGLGLSVTYSIIKNHKGYVHVESKVGIGTTFHVLIPASTKEINLEETDEGMLILGEGKVMVMDDEEVIREVTKEMLELIGYEVSLARDGVETLELYKQAIESGHSFDAIIMDLTIPGGMGGKQAIIEILKIDPGVKAIVSSGYSKDPIMANFREYGFRDSVAKPYKIQELSRKLHTVITGLDE